jgi:hypothetical protein
MVPARSRRHHGIARFIIMKNLFCGAVILFGVVSLSAATVTISPVADTTLHQGFPDNNLGGLAHVGVGDSGVGALRTLYRFDLSSIPAGATVTSVKLNFAVTKAAFGTGPTVELHRMLQPWVEGNKVGITANHGDAATTGESTWNNRSHPSTAWQAAGAAGSTDASSTVSASIAVDSGTTFSVSSTAGLVADVQGWVTNSSSNNGWLLKAAGAGSARLLSSRETAGGGPTLEITYSGGAASDIHVDSIVRNANDLTLTWTGGLPQYQVATSTNVAGPWTLVGPKTAATNATVALPTATTFFRVAGQVP